MDKRRKEERSRAETLRRKGRWERTKDKINKIKQEYRNRAETLWRKEKNRV
jgi:hypothetical protein